MESTPFNQFDSIAAPGNGDDDVFSNKINVFACSASELGDRKP